MRRTGLVALGVAGSFVVSFAAAAPPLYRIAKLPSPVTVAYEINNLGQIAGVASVDGREAAVIWSATAGLVDIGAIGGLTASRALAISDDGLVAGIGGIDPALPWGGFLYDPARGVIPTGRAAAGYPRGIANGARATGGLDGHAVVWRWGSTLETQDLGDLPGGLVGTEGMAINEAGHVVGVGNSSVGNRAFLWTAGSGLTSLGTLPGYSFVSLAADINNANQVVGLSGASGGVVRAFLWTAAGGMKDLGELPGGQEFGDARAINEFGQVVGYSTAASLPGLGEGRAFLWQDGLMYDLNDLVDPGDPLKGKLLLYMAESINERGQIVGQGILISPGADPVTAAFLLTPISADVDVKLNTSVVAGCKSVSGTVTLLAPAPAGGRVVELRDGLSSASTPATVTIPAGATSKSFTITTVPVKEPESSFVFARLDGVNAKAQPLTVRPMGVASLGVTPATVVGGQAVTGKASLECAAGPGPVTVDLSTSNPVVAHPVATTVVIPQGLKSQTFTVATNPVLAKSSAMITGEASTTTKSRRLNVVPAAAVSPTRLPFGSVAVGQTVGPLSATLTNKGAVPFSVNSISLTGTAASWFAQTNDCPANLAAGASCSISVTFTPLAAASKSAKLSIATGATATPLSVSLSGTGVLPP